MTPLIKNYNYLIFIINIKSSGYVDNPKISRNINKIIAYFFVEIYWNYAQIYNFFKIVSTANLS